MRKLTYADGTRSLRAGVRSDLQLIDEHRVKGGTVHLRYRIRT